MCVSLCYRHNLRVSWVEHRAHVSFLQETTDNKQTPKKIVGQRRRWMYVCSVWGFLSINVQYSEKFKFIICNSWIISQIYYFQSSIYLFWWLFCSFYHQAPRIKKLFQLTHSVHISSHLIMFLCETNYTPLHIYLHFILKQSYLH